MSDTLVLYDRAMIDHEPGPGHPERPGRLEAIESALTAANTAGTRWEAPEEATLDQVERVHVRHHVQEIARLRGESVSLDPDTHVSTGSVRAALLAAGASVRAVDAVCRGEASNAFALVRPPGHHAEANRAMGFCLYNNVAIAAAHAKATGLANRVLIIDWDVHHGNGTQAIFYDDPDVAFFSTHQFPFYPGTGASREQGRGAGLGATINVPFATGAGNGDYLLAFRELLTPVAEAFKPELVLVSAGFDAHERDPLGGMNVDEEGFAELCAITSEIASSHADGRLALFLEGGYDLEGLSRSVVACMRVLTGSSAPGVSAAATPKGSADVRDAVSHHRAHWKSL